MHFVGKGWKYLWVILSVLFFGAQVGSAGDVDYEELIGADGMDYMNTLPILRDHVICREASTHDKKGGNDNGFSNKAEFVRREKGRRVVVLDVAGPGSIQSFWYSWPNQPGIPESVENFWAKMKGNVDFYFDGEDSAGMSIALRDMVGTSPHTYPLAVNADESTGGYITYVPLPFQDGAKVTIDGGRMPMFFYHLWYHSYPLGTKVDTWTGNENLAKILEDWDPANKDKFEMTVRNTRHTRENLTFTAGQSHTIFDSTSFYIGKTPPGGAVHNIRIKLPEDHQALRSLWLQGYWDDDTEPSVDVPLSLFYAVDHRFSEKPMGLVDNVEIKSTVIGQDSEGLYYFRLPMPYARQGRLSIVNRGNEKVTIDKVIIDASNQEFPGVGKSAGYFRTRVRESRELTPGRDYLLAHLYGRGHIVGTVLSVEDTPETFLEGDEHVYTDGGRSPLVIGDATETYFNGSWYFCNQAFSCPLHGAPTFRKDDKKIGAISDMTMYRFHLTDFVPFRSEARFSIQHGPFNNVPGHYRSVVFYYGLDDKSLFETDFLAMADKHDLEAHGFSGPAPVRTKHLSGFFEGEFNGQDLGLKKRPKVVSAEAWMLSLTVASIFYSGSKDSVDAKTFTVCEHSGPYEFTARIDPENSGVMLRRLFDQSVPDQRAIIEVDGEKAGVWYNAGHNKYKIWMEDDLVLDPSVTAGKSEVRIRVVPVSESFSAVEYKVFSIVLP